MMVTSNDGVPDTILGRPTPDSSNGLSWFCDEMCLFVHGK
jgi:hypothetical protein